MNATERAYASGGYAARNPDLGRWYAQYKAEEIGKILARNGVHPASICDVGCGSGDVLTNVAKHAPSARDCVGYDVFQPSQAWEKNTNPRVRFRLADFATSDER